MRKYQKLFIFIDKKQALGILNGQYSYRHEERKESYNCNPMDESPIHITVRPSAGNFFAFASGNSLIFVYY
jgi:hypothetical protein